MMTFKVGDIVKLKSGGPEMSVTNISPMPPHAGTIRCQWFAAKKLESGYFAAETLERVSAHSAPEKK